MKRNLQVLTIDGQAATSPAGAVVGTMPNFRGGIRIHSVLAVLTAASSAITVNYPGDTILRVNGTQQRGLTPTQTDGLNILNNPPGSTFGTAAATPYSIQFSAATAAELEYYFSEPWMPMGMGERYALDLLENEICTLEVGYAAVTPAATVQFRVVYELLSEVVASGRKLNRTSDGRRATMVKHTRSSEPTGAADITMQKLNKQFNGRETIQHIRLFSPTSRSIERVVVKLNDQDIFNRSRWENAKELRSAGMNPTVATVGVGAFDVVFSATDSLREGLLVGPGDKLDVIVTYDAAASANQLAIVQHFGPVN